jgi:hypothetical protein
VLLQADQLADEVGVMEQRQHAALEGRRAAAPASTFDSLVHGRSVTVTPRC